MKKLFHHNKLMHIGLAAGIILILAACAPAAAAPTIATIHTLPPEAAAATALPTASAAPSATIEATQLPTVSVPVTGNSDDTGYGSGSDKSGSGSSVAGQGKGGSGGDDTGYGSPSKGSSTPAAGNAATVNSADTSLGKILVDSKGMTLYLYTKDAPGVSNCAGACLKIWPPLLTTGAPLAGPGVDGTKLGTAALADGTQMVTYKGYPLYYYAEDSQPGDVTGQKVDGEWFVLAP